ncbi:MAG: hypothetical protein KF901_07130 [Myxococcales bacterium]|nr:hypothetical protein [Myxococcales bacterium]
MKRLALVALVVLSSACSSGLRIRTPTLTAPPRGAVTVVQVQIGEMPRDRVQMLERWDVPGVMQARISEALQRVGGLVPQGGVMVAILINSFRNGGFGPAVLGTQVQIIDVSGNVLHAFEANDTSMTGSRTNRLQRLVQSVVNQIATQL